MYIFEKLLIHMKNFISIVLVCLILTTFSCNQNLRQKNGAGTNTDQTTFIEENTDRIGQEFDKLPNEILEFTPTNYSVLDIVSGDLNFDRINDYLLVLRKNGEDTLSNIIDNPEKRPLLILLRDQNNKLQLAKRNDNSVYCFDCGGMLGDPFVGVEINNDYFSVEHYGGSAWRWSRTITYKYSKEDKDWYLYKDILKSFHASEPEKEEIKIRTEKDFGKVKFEDFDIYKED